MDEQSLQIGKLTQAVDTLTVAVKDLTDRLESVENKYRTGRGFAFGALVVVGFMVYGAKDFIGKVLGAVF